MDAQVIFPSVICQRRIIKSCFVKDNSKHRERNPWWGIQIWYRWEDGGVKRDLSVHVGNYLLWPTSEYSFSRRKMWHTSVCSTKTFQIEKNIKQDRICLCLWAAPWPGLQTQLYISKSSNLVRQHISFGSVRKWVHVMVRLSRLNLRIWISLMICISLDGRHSSCKILWIYLTHPSGTEPIERVCKGEAKLGKWWTNLLSITLKWTN